MSIENINQKPASSVLILANALVWFLYTLVSTFEEGPIGIIVMVIGLIFILVITTTAQIILHFVLRRKQLSAKARITLFSLPSIFLMLIFILLPKPPSLPNQTQDKTSPSGKYVLSVPIKKNTSVPRMHGIRVWKVTIKNRDGKIEYVDNDSTFTGLLNVYWFWDDQDRVWLYNSDTSDVYFWRKEGINWMKYHWGYGHTKEFTEEIVAPASLYPHYDQ